MNKHLQMNPSKILVLVVLMMLALTGWSQEYKQGIKQGTVKVKFSPEMTSSLNQMNVRVSSNGLTTGLNDFDQVARAASATNMIRLFPYDPKFESKLRSHGLHLWYVVEIDKAKDPAAIAKEFKKLNGVLTAEVEREKSLAPYNVIEHNNISANAVNSAPFNDPMLGDQWHYNNTGQIGTDADINLFNAWTSSTGANNIVISVHDQGVDVKHVDLKANIWINTNEIPNNGIDDDGNGYVDDINGFNFDRNSGAIDAQYHGTHVAGTIAAVNNNGIGVAGVAGGNGTGNGVKIMSMQFLGGGSVENTYIYAANNGAVISQNSWGYTSPYYVEQSVLDAIDYFVDEAGDFVGSPMKGGIVIFAAGNSNYDAEWYPGYYENTMSVSAIGPDWKKAGYSNYGAWVEIAAPGGDISGYGGVGGVLSTIPKDKYAYLEGTSMACPHVSGIAALALANRARQLTAEELWNKLVTGVVNIDMYNEEYIGKLGSGAIDASLAIKNDQGIAPVMVTNLTVTGIAQEFATLSWTVPADTDDGQPMKFQLYHHTQAITAGNLTSADKTVITNDQLAGTEFTYELQNLLGLTQYHFALTSTDRWGNVSVLSNAVSATTNEGPSIAVDANSQSISIMVDASVETSGTHDITILNEAAGILRWNHFMRHSSGYLAYNAAGLNYPVASSKKRASEGVVAQRAVAPINQLRSNEPQALTYQSIEKSYSSYPTNIIGETNLSLTNSAAAKFFVTEADGFNLTNVQMYLKHDPAIGPVIMEIYQGETPTNANMVYAQEHSNWSTDESNAYITLNEQIYFESGSTFWIVFHVPAGNLFPLGIGWENDPEYSKYCYMSFDLGGSWTPLETALGSKDFAWSMTASSYNAHLGTYLTLEPGSGDVAGNDQGMTTLLADASTLINGTYNANMVISSNDATNRELRIPVTLEVSGHQPKIRHIDIAEFGQVFVNGQKTLDLVIENTGFGNFNDPIFMIDNPSFSIVDYAPWQIQAREEVVVKVKFTPTAPGNANGIMEFTNGNQTYQIYLFGVGAETSKMSITPENQTVNDLAIGDVVNAQILVENTGAYPLKYFIPGFDEKGISDNWPVDYHSYGYKYRTSYASESSPIAYDFQDISTTGTDVTETVKAFGKYAEVDMGFDFPYYGENLQTLYVAKQGFTTFDNTVNPINTPRLGDSWGPKGYISPLGTFVDLTSQGKILYEVLADRVIVQWDNITDGYSGVITAQMVLHSNGNIRFYYESMYDSWAVQYLNILIEDLYQQDGILKSNYEMIADIYAGLAIGFDYPGPDIITNVSNGSGILSPGGSALVDLTMQTNDLNEGITNRYVNFISNDPTKSQFSALVQLEVTSGGVAMPQVSVEDVAFGDVFQGANISRLFTIKNQGSANVNITDMAFTNGSFLLSGNYPITIVPGMVEKYAIQIPTGTLATLEDWLTIDYADGSDYVIHITGNVVDAPAINVDLSIIQETLAYGESTTHPLSVENTGLAPMEVSFQGKHWLSYSTAEPMTSSKFAYEKLNKGEVYQWLDIRETGTQMPFAENVFDEADYWRDLTLPFPIIFQGEEYYDIKIGENGIISLESNPEVRFFTDNIPSQEFDGKYIMPYWAFGGFSTMFFPEDEVGIFYQFEDDKIIITWSYIINNFGGMGDPVSAQVIFYENGSMKFQYRVEEFGVDLTSQVSTIGVQYSSEAGLSISAYNPLDHGTSTGLAFVLTPVDTYTVAAGSTLTGDVNIDARNIYGGVYNESLKINTNVPNSENLEKPVELIVTGDGVVDVPASVDFGSQMIELEWGSPVRTYVQMNIANTGSAPFDITWAQMTDGTMGLSLEIYAVIQGWFGPETRYADISELYSPWAWETPVFTVNPGDKVKARAAFGPSYSGDFMDDLVLTTSVGDITVSMTGTGVEPPAMNVDDTAIEVSMNVSTETATPSISIDNLNGFSDLAYEVSIDFGRANATSASAKQLAGTDDVAVDQLIQTAATPSASAMSVATVYNRTISHTEATNPDTFVGTGGSAPFTVATKYNAGASGFNLSHIQTWMKTEALAQGPVSVEVRAGGSDISESVIVGEGQTTFTAIHNDWFEIVLNEPVGIYPNEDFYIVVTYPLGIQLPQGTLTGLETSYGTYYYESEGLWYDLQEESGFGGMGWLMYAAEETAGNSSWLSITSMTSGTIVSGEQSTIDLLIEGAYSQRGDQVANVIVRSNDPNNSEVMIPVRLHMNEAPHFNNVPEEVVVSENEVRTINISVVDVEGHDFTVTSDETYAGLAFEYASGILSVTLSPDYGDAGNYTFVFTSTDEHGAIGEMELNVEVLRVNQAPKYVGPVEGLTYGAVGDITEHNIGDYFVDPDGDSFTFDVSTGNAAIVDVFKSSGKFLVKTVTTGETSLMFSLKDSQGAEAQVAVDVLVNLVASVNDHLDYQVKAYPNPTSDNLLIHIDGELAGAYNVRVLNLMGVIVQEMKEVPSQKRDVVLNLSELSTGIYLVEIADEKGTSVHRVLKN